LSKYIARTCGIHLESEKAYLIETRLTKLMAMCGCETFGEFHQLAESGKDASLPEKIINAITTNETLWFRDAHPFKIFSEVMLPELAEQLRSGKLSKARIWSAASATGQEPYSLAMCIHEFCRQDQRVRPEQFEIIATDISSSALAIAKSGRYDQLAVARGLPEEMKSRHFTLDGRVWQIDPRVAQTVTFKRYNLQDSPALLGRFEVVFIRYVLIYFTDELKKKIFENIAGLQNMPGFLVVGGTESLRGLTERFKLESHAGGAYYRKSN